MAQLQGSIG